MGKLSWGNLKIGVKYNIALFTTILLFIVAAGLITSSLFTIRESVNDIEIKNNRSMAISRMDSLFRMKELLVSDFKLFSSESTMEEYKIIKDQFDQLESEISTSMESEDSSLQFGLIIKNNQQMDDLFVNQVIPNTLSDNEEEALAGFIKTMGLRQPTAQLFERINETIDSERQLSVTVAFENIQASIIVLLGGILGAAVLGCLLVFLISRGISQNLNRVVKAADQVAAGRLDLEEIQYRGQDEVGQLSMAMNKMVVNLRNMIHNIAESAVRVDEESSTLNLVAGDVQQNSEQIGSTMFEMASGAQEQAGAAAEIADSIYSLTQLIGEANQNKEILEASSHDILKVIQNEKVHMATSIQNMEQINGGIKDAVTKIKLLDENSKKVSTLGQVINAIAEQTNLLALNAAIEAARAGEAGKGFAVVADEIRKLAEQVGNSVNEITNIVDNIQKDTKSMTDSLVNGYESIEESTGQIKITGEGFDKMHREVIAMGEQIQLVAASLEEIAANSNKISTAGEQVAAISQENSASVEETVASMEQQNSSMEMIAQNAGSLSASANVLKGIVGQFKI